MKFQLLFSFLMMVFLSRAQDGRFHWFAGTEYRFYPIDLEDAPRGGYTAYGLPQPDTKFWKALSLQTGLGWKSGTRTMLRFQFFARYNQLHRTSGINENRPEAAPQAVKKNFKYDLFLGIERSFFNRQKRGISSGWLAGLYGGVANLNTRFNIEIQDTSLSGPASPKIYQGNMANVAGRITLGYQYHRLRAELVALFTEGPDQTRLLTYWPGFSLQYELLLKRRKGPH